MKRQTERLIKEMVQRIVAGFNPEKVIIFGSYARGNAGTDSDVDLLVVMRVRGSKRKTQLRIRTALHDILLPKDVIVSDVAEFDWRKDVVGTIECGENNSGDTIHNYFSPSNLLTTQHDNVLLRHLIQIIRNAIHNRALLSKSLCLYLLL